MLRTECTPAGGPGEGQLVERGGDLVARQVEDVLGERLQASADRGPWAGLKPSLTFTIIYLQFFTYYLVETLFNAKRHLGVSDDEAKRRAAYDLQWKVALGVELDVRPFTKSTLQEFRAQLIVHQEQEAIFKQSLELAKRQGYFKGKKKLKVALDTTHILGHGAVKDTYNRVPRMREEGSHVVDGIHPKAMLCRRWG